jgi:hypothetical protein
VYLLFLFNHQGFDAAGVLRGKGCSYRKFRELIDAFREHYGLMDFSYKDIDKYLYTSGTALIADREAAKLAASNPV